MPNPPEFMEAVDAQGQRIQIPWAAWRDTIIVPNLLAAYDDYDTLAWRVREAASQGLNQEALEPAKRLCEIAPQAEKGYAASLLGHVQHRLGQFEESRQTLQAAIDSTGPEGFLYTNLGLALEGLGDIDGAKAAWWKALELSPDFDDGLLLLMDRALKAGGAGQRSEVLKQAAQLPGVWWPQIWLGTEELHAGKVADAVVHFREAIRRSPKLSQKGLETISGQLGKADCLREAVDLCEPIFDPEFHGIQAANNMMMLYMGLDEVPKARAILEKLYALQRPDWKRHIDYWEDAIGRREHSYGEVDMASLRIASHCFQMPFWGRPGGGPDAGKQASAIRIAVFAGSVGKTMVEDKVVAEPPDVAGRVSRAIPLFIAEQISVRTDARGVFQCWLTDTGSFMLSGVPTKVSEVKAIACEAEYALLLNVDAFGKPYTLQAHLIRVEDSSTIASWQEVVASQWWYLPAQALADKVIATLESMKVLQTTPSGFLPPAGETLEWHLFILEKALAVRSNLIHGVKASALIAERSILDDALDVVRRAPGNRSQRLQLWSTFQDEATKRPDIGREYMERVTSADAVSGHGLPVDPLIEDYRNRVAKLIVGA